MKAQLKSKNIFKKGDVILLAVLIAAIVAAAVLATRQTSSTVEIYCDGNLIRTQSIYDNTEFKILDGKMTVKIQKGQLSVTHSDCVEQLCVHTAPITEDGGMIVCLPNKVVIKLAYKDVAAVTSSVGFRKECGFIAAGACL